MLIPSPGSAKDDFRGFSNEELNTTNEKMEQQQQHLQHIKRLLSTAATGTGIVGDLDAPTIQNLTSPTTTMLTTAPRKPERNLWRLEEIKEMLTIMQETNALELLNDKMIKSESVFHDIEKMMIRRGYNKKSHNQIWTKWKFLKSTYMTSSRNGVIPKMIPMEIYTMLDNMLGNGNENNFSFEDSSNAPSFDGENSTFANEEIDGTTVIKSKSNNMSTVEKPEAFGMAHPIFGFRLGIVKSEPADTGYETTANNSVISENDSIENSAVYPVEISPQNSQDNSNRFKAATAERVTGSPEANSASKRSPTPDLDDALLMPRETAAMSIRPLAVKQKITPTRASATATTALRIAPFAKETNITKETARKECISPATLRTTEVSSAFDGSMFAVSPAISLPAASPRGSIVRLPKDVTLKLRSKYAQQINSTFNPTTATSASNSKYALRALREEHYAQRIQTTPATHLSQQQQHAYQQDQPMTSQMAKLRASILNKKRRLEIPNWETAEPQPLPKLSRFANASNINNSGSTNLPQHNSYHANKARLVMQDDGLLDDDANDDNDEVDNYYARGTQSFTQTASQKSKANYQQPYHTPIHSMQKPKAPTTTTPPTIEEKPSKNRTPMEEVLKDMAMSLRQSQLQMVNDFFEQQMELARKDHEFQMEQDRLMMIAFKKQTQQLMKVAKELFNPNSNANGNFMKAPTMERHTKLLAKSKTNINGEQYKTKNTRELHNQISNQHFELSSSESDELQENGDSDPLLSSFDPTQFVSSELVEINDDENDEDECLV